MSKSVTNENNIRKRIIPTPTHLNLNISIPLTNNADTYLESLKETLLKIKKKNIKKHPNLSTENIKVALPVQTEVEHNSSFNYVKKQSLATHSIQRDCTGDTESSILYLNNLNSPATTMEKATKPNNTDFSLSSLLDRLDSTGKDHFNSNICNSKEILLEKNIGCENNLNISISKEESSMAGHKTHDQDLNSSKPQKDFNSSVNISVQEATHEEMSPIVTDNHNKSMSPIYDINDIQYTLKKKKKKIHLSEMLDYKGINAETNNESTDYGITSCVVNRQQEPILNFEEYSQKDKRIHKSKSKKRKFEICNEKVNYVSMEDELSLEKVSSEAVPQINDNLEKNILNLEKQNCVIDCVLNKDVLSKSRNKNENDREYSRTDLTENNTVEKCKSIESTLSGTKKKIDSHIEGKSKAKEMEVVDNIVINDLLKLQSLENQKSNDIQPNSDQGTDFREDSISENVNAKCTIKTSESIKEQHTKQNNKVKGKNDHEGKDKMDKVENTKEKKSKVTKRKLSMIENDESSDDEQNNLDGVMNFVKNFIQKSPNFKMNATKLHNITDSTCTNRKNEIKSSNTNKLLSFDSSDGFSSDDSLGGFTKLFSKDSDNKCKAQEIQKSKTKGISKKTKQKKKSSNITVPQNKQQVVNCDKRKDNVTLSETETGVNKKQCQDFKTDLENVHSSRTESSSLATNASVIKSNTPDVGNSTGSKLVTGTDRKNTPIKSFESKTGDNKITKYFEYKNIKSNNQMQEQNKSSESSQSVLKQNKQKVEKSVKSKREILESETSSSTVDTDDDHKKNIKTNKGNQINNLQEEIHLKNNITSFETMEKMETSMNQETSGSREGADNKSSKSSQSVPKQHKQKVKKPVKSKREILESETSSSSVETDDEHKKNIKTNKRNQINNLHEEIHLKDNITSFETMEKMETSMNQETSGSREGTDNKSSKSSQSVPKQHKQKVKKAVKSKREILESETSSSSLDTDYEHKKNIKTNKKNQINNLHEEIHLKDNITSFETMEKMESSMNQETSGLREGTDNKSSKSSQSVPKQHKQKVKKAVKSKREILESETSSSSLDTDYEHKKNIKTNKKNQINNLHEKIHLKDSIISFEIMKKMETLINQESSGSSEDINNKSCENITKEQGGRVPKLEITNSKNSSSSSDTDEESEENARTNKLIEKVKLQERKDSGKAKKLMRNKNISDIYGKELVKSEKLTKPAKKKFKKIKNNPSEDTDHDESEKTLVLNYFDKILKERYNGPTKKSKRSASVDSDGSSNDMRGVSDFRTDKDSDSDNEETKLKMIEILDRADNDLLNVMEENEELSNLNIQIDWDVHISHTIETRISSCPTAEQRRLFKSLNLKMKTGPYTKVENDTIKSNFKKFCEVHGLKHNPVPFLNFKYGTHDLLPKKQRINFARYIGRGLENRMLFCIYHRFKVIYSTFSKGRFKPEEDAVIKHYIQTSNNSKSQYSDLSKILQRPRLAVERRYKYLQKDQGKIYPSTYTKFVHCIMEVTQVNEVEELRRRQITDEEWTSVSKILKIDVEKLKLCWMASLYTKLFHGGPIHVDKIMKELLNTLDKTKQDDFRQLDWTKLAKPFKAMTRGFLYRIFKRAMRSVVPPEMHSNLRRCVVYLKNRYSTEEHIMENISNITINI